MGCSEEDLKNENGYTVTYIPWEDDEGKEVVIGRFTSEHEKDKFLEKIYDDHSGFTLEELSSVSVIDNINYMPLR